MSHEYSPRMMGVAYVEAWEYCRPLLSWIRRLILLEKIRSARVTITNKGVTTVLLGASTNIISYELERVSVLTRDSRIVPGAGATEIKIARRLKKFAFKETRSSNQIVIAKYAESFELIPKTLAQKANLNVEGIIETLYADHAAGNVKVGIDLKNEDCKDAFILNMWDLYTTKNGFIGSLLGIIRSVQDNQEQVTCFLVYREASTSILTYPVDV